MKMVINRAAASRVLSGVVKRLPGETLLKDTATNTRTMASKAVTLENLNPNIIKLEYAVRGPLVIRAGEIEKELEKVRALTIL